jgi:ethanolamine-phosphate cytidylyltransferase
MAESGDSPLSASSFGGTTGQVRIFMDGAFDMMHFGHMNAFRLGRELGTHLIVGVNSDESITECKGPPLMNNDERLTMVESCKFVDQVLPGCPYIMNKEYLDYIIREYKVDFVIHGDDPCIVDGKDVYATAKDAGKYKSIPRTEGISTTDIVGRVLLMSKNNLTNGSTVAAGPPPILGHTSRFLTTTSLLSKFSAGNEEPKPESCVVYIDGDFDMFHCGHVAMLQAAKAVSLGPKYPAPWHAGSPLICVFCNRKGIISWLVFMAIRW